MAEVIEKSGVHLTGADSGWPVAGTAEAEPKKDGTGSDPHVRASEVADGVVEVSERQRLVIDATSGQLKLTYDGQQTADIDFDPTSAELVAALEALSNVAPGDVSATGPSVSGNQRTYYVTFGGTLADTDVPQMTVQAGTVPLAGGGAAATVTTITPGS